MKVYIAVEIFGSGEIDKFGIAGVFFDFVKAEEFKVKKETEFNELASGPYPDINENSSKEDLELAEKISDAHFFGEYHINIEEHEVQ